MAKQKDTVKINRDKIKREEVNQKVKEEQKKTERKEKAKEREGKEGRKKPDGKEKEKVYIAKKEQKKTPKCEKKELIAEKEKNKNSTKTKENTCEKRKLAGEQDGPEKKKKKKPSGKNEKVDSDPTDAKQGKELETQNERYHPNRFIQNTDSEQQGKSYRYFVRPFVPFWSAQKLTFEQINNEKEIPGSRTGPCSKRYVFQHLGKTWLSDDPWFDKKEIFELVEEDLILKLDSVSYGYKKELIRTYLLVDCILRMR